MTRIAYGHSELAFQASETLGRRLVEASPEAVAGEEADFGLATTFEEGRPENHSQRHDEHDADVD
ncbi:hypothetical protein ASG60_00645 [Methylobacterium sp. Leaf469]|nr:hypothetical protein ASG60_00645 [Methylobacterium sp. Leaf469]